MTNSKHSSFLVTSSSGPKQITQKILDQLSYTLQCKSNLPISSNTLKWLGNWLIHCNSVLSGSLHLLIVLINVLINATMNKLPPPKKKQSRIVCKSVSKWTLQCHSFISIYVWCWRRLNMFEMYQLTMSSVDYRNNTDGRIYTKQIHAVVSLLCLQHLPADS